MVERIKAINIGALPEGLSEAQTDGFGPNVMRLILNLENFLTTSQNFPNLSNWKRRGESRFHL